MARTRKKRLAENREKTAPVQTTPKDTPFVGAAKLVAHVALDSVRYRGFSAQSSGIIQTLTPETTLNFVIRFLRPTVEPTANEREYKVSTTFIFRVSGKTSTDDVETLATIRASYELLYIVSGKAPAFEPAELNDFALCYGAFHSWGYWREYVQSALARLDLPTLTLPLFRIQMAPSLVIDSVD